MALTLDGTTGISATGNIYGNNMIVTNALTVGSFVPSVLSSTGNITGGNLLTGGLISATGSLTAGSATINGDLTVTGNASLTGNIVADKIVNGTTEIAIQTANGNANVTVAGTSNVVVFTSGGINITGISSASGNVTGGNLLTGGLISAAGSITTGGDHSLTGNIVDTGTLWINTLANGNINLNVNGTGQTNIPTGILSVTGNIQGGNLITAGIISATGNITGSYILGNGSQLTGVDATQIINGTSNAKVVSSGGNIAVGIGGTANVAVFATTGAYVTGVVSATGAITGAAITGSSLTVSTGNINGGNINNTNANGVGNIGNSTVYFNTVFGKATTAQYADLAELYSADAKYEPGTVLDFGGTNEVTISSVASSARVAGVVSTNPAHLMNSVLESEHKVAVALTGRVPTSVVGTVRKGDMMVTAGNGFAQACAAPAMGTVIGKALENFDGVSGTIEIVVGRL